MPMQMTCKMYVLIASLLLVSCSEDEPIPAFTFQGTVNGENVMYTCNNITLSKGLDFETNKMDYGQVSRFGKFWPAGGNNGISFKFVTCEIQDFELINMFRDPLLFDDNNDLVEFRVNTIINDEKFSSDSAKRENKSIEIKRIYKTEAVISVSPDFKKGHYIAMEGELEYKTEDVEVKGYFTLMLVEFE